MIRFGRLVRQNAAVRFSPLGMPRLRGPGSLSVALASANEVPRRTQAERAWPRPQNRWAAVDLVLAAAAGSGRWARFALPRWDDAHHGFNRIQTGARGSLKALGSHIGFV